MTSIINKLFIFVILIANIFCQVAIQFIDNGNNNTIHEGGGLTGTDEDIDQTGYDALTYDWTLISGDSANIDDFDNLIYVDSLLYFNPQVEYNSDQNNSNSFSFSLQKIVISAWKLMWEESRHI